MDTVPDEIQQAVTRASTLTKTQNAVRRVTQLLAGLPLDEQARWIVHVLAALDPCEPAPDRFGAEVLQRVRAAIEHRMSQGQW